MYNCSGINCRITGQSHVTLPHSDKLLSEADLLKKIAKAKSHLSHLSNRLGEKGNTHGGKTYREHKSSIQLQMEVTQGRIDLYKTAQNMILQCKQEISEQAKRAKEEISEQAKRAAVTLQTISRTRYWKPEDKIKSQYSTLDQVEKEIKKIHFTQFGQDLSVCSTGQSAGQIQYDKDLNELLNYMVYTGKIHSYTCTRNAGYFVRHSPNAGEPVVKYELLGPEVTKAVLENAHANNISLYEASKNVAVN